MKCHNMRVGANNQSGLVNENSTKILLKDPIIKPILKLIQLASGKLGNEKFLESCKNIVSSNKESFHILWGLAAKYFLSSAEIETTST